MGRTWPLLLALVSTIAVAVSLPAASALPARVTACAVTSAKATDWVCRNKPVLLMRMGPRPPVEVRTSAARLVPPRSLVSVLGFGVADLFLNGKAECQAILGASLQTRQPKSALFTHFFGTTLCTMAHGSVVQVDGYATLQAASGGQASVTRFRTFLEPGAVFEVDVPRIGGVKGGGLLVTPSKRKSIRILPGESVVLTLAGPSTTLRVDKRGAEIPDEQISVLMRQGKLIKP